MNSLGIDLGSRRTKLILWEDGLLKEKLIFQSWAIDRENVSNAVERLRTAETVVGTTGYGRVAGAEAFSGQYLTEIRAFSIGMRYFAPDAAMIVDIGGQDAKVITLDDDGTVADFEMNDRCAAGTGKFFEMVAVTIGTQIGRLSELALSSEAAAQINSTCAVFAESELIGRMADGAGSAELAKGVFRSVAERLVTMIHRTGFREPAWLVGGGACAALAAELERLLKIKFLMHPDGVFSGAVGAALNAAGQQQKGKGKGL